jgi:ABC-2 type transport system permease protein
MTLITPILLGLLIFAPAYLSSVSSELEKEEQKNIAVVENDDFYFSRLINSDQFRFTKIPESEVNNIKSNFSESSYYAILDFTSEENTINFISDKQLNKSIVSEIERYIIKIKLDQNYKELDQNYKDAGIDISVLSELEPNLKFNNNIITEDGNEQGANQDIRTAIAYVFGFLIYIFIFMYGSMVMRGVIEEKTNRIVEVIISSVKPFQLLIGKIIGVALVGFTQFVLWVLLSILVANIAGNTFLSDNPVGIFDSISYLLVGINLNSLILYFMFYFIGGYLLYSSFFACIGAAVDNETDTHQMVLPVTIPLILSMAMITAIVNNPDGALSFWMSIFPLSSPIVMMVRLPFGGVENWEILLSATVLLLSFLLTTWVSSRIYRIGILMYGKKASFRELYRWIKFKG